MGKISMSERLQQALNRADIPPAARREVHNAMFAKYAKAEAQAAYRRDAQWAALVDSIREARASLTSNKSKWPDFLVPTYLYYTDLLSLLVQKVEVAASEIMPDGKQITIAQYSARMRARNIRRASEGRKPLGNCTSVWQSWVPPHIRKDVALKVELAYTLREAGGGAPRRGKRFVPFVTSGYKQQQAQRAVTLTNAIQRLRHNYATSLYPDFRANNPHGAFMLAMCRKAERALAKIVQDGLNFERQVPVNLTHLLEAKDRPRLKAAQENPNGVAMTPDIRGFYYEPKEGEEIEYGRVTADTVLFEHEDAEREGGDVSVDYEEHS